MTNVAKYEAPSGPEATSLVEVIARAAQDPSTDVDKLERLMGMYERITARQAEVEFHAAMADMQPKLPPIERRGKGDSGKWSYAKWEDAVGQIAPILSEHGFSLTFRVRHEGETVVVTAVLAHKGGHSIQSDAPPMLADKSGSKNAVQALGSSVSYGKRYAAFALLNIAARDEDDDGGAGGRGATINEAQFVELRGLIEQAGADEAKFLAFLGAQHLETLPAAKFAGAVQALRRKIKQGGA